MSKPKLGRFVLLPALALASAVALAAQPPPPGEPGWPPPSPPGRQGQPPGRSDRPARGMDAPPGERSLRASPEGRPWIDPAAMRRLGLTSEQQGRIDGLLQQHRLKLIDLSAALQREEALLDPMLDQDPPDESKILVQTDRVAQARAELEKANGRLLLGFRRVLNQDQWKKLHEGAPPRPPRDR